MRAFRGFLIFLLALIQFAQANASEAQFEPRRILLHRERSLYRNIFVTQQGDQRCMLFRYPRPAGRQSCKLLHEPDKLIAEYSQMMLAALYLNPKPSHVLIIGEGGGTVPAALQEILPDAQIDLVELDSSVDKVARAFFDFSPGSKTRVIIQDGRVFVKRMIPQKPNYDLVILDAFDADYIPEHMLTREFLEEVKSDMAQEGVIVSNTFSASALYDNESETYRAVFGPFFNLKRANRVILGRVGGITSDGLQLVRMNAMLFEQEFARRGTGSKFLLPLLSRRVDWNTNVRLLTDQYSPSNLLNSVPRSH